ncbi:electron transfer flavoprotein subunit beta/FixA family protein [Desulfatirhabdium butyrativorans]|uniref:electron transfer flavoprotein subunit beta/FixA family protein n=1 Tax=Desulfatirhabdium butyrativorans TaxID=340467 RepID=UPI000405947A|nr:hypothetical protein [Desulfatirhabdium butyrativorans]
MRLCSVVCIKAIPDETSEGYRGVPGSPDASDEGRFRMNRYDAYSLEAALGLKSQFGDMHIHALGIGPSGTESVLKRAIGMGADAAWFFRTEPSDGDDPFRTAHCIAEVIGSIDCNLLFFGYMAEDSQRGLVGPMTAALLDWPCVSAVVSERGDPDAFQKVGLRLERELEGGIIEEIACRLPAVLTIQTRATTPRYPALSRMLRSAQAIETLSADPIERVSIPQRQGRIDAIPPRASRCLRLLDGPVEAQALSLLKILSEEHRIFAPAP